MQNAQGGRARIAVVAREVAPFGGGIGTYAASLAAFFEKHGAEVTLFLSSLRGDEMAELSRGGDLLFSGGVRIVTVPEPAPGDDRGYFSHFHHYSARVFEALCETYGDDGPDLIEFPDYLGEGAVTVQARRTGHRTFRDTVVVVRLNTTTEICSVLNGFVAHDFTHVGIEDLERYALRFSDHLIYGGGDILGTYERFYGRRTLAPGHLVRQPIEHGSAAPGAPPPTDGPLKLLYIGRLERRKGVQNLVRAMTGVGEDGVELTLLGGDTGTAPLGGSMRRQLEQMACADPRIHFVDHIDRRELPALIDAHHVGVFPSLWECWPAVALETLSRNRPIVGTPVGGLSEMVQPGRSGWLVPHADDPRALSDTITELVRERDAVHRLMADGGPVAVHDELTDVAPVVEWYERVLSQGVVRPRRRRPAARPLVSVVVPYFRLAAHVEQTVRSVIDQTYRQVELIIVDDGSFELEDRVLMRLATQIPIRVAVQPNSGLGAARNFGIRLSRGKYVVPLDADNLLTPDFIARAVDVLEEDPDMAFVTTWSTYIDEQGEPLDALGSGYQAISNTLRSMDLSNVAGDAAGMIRRSVFDRGHWYSPDLTSYEDWELYRELRDAGLVGHTIPERLLLYRVRDGSMLRAVGMREQDRLEGEMRAQDRRWEVTWERQSA